MDILIEELQGSLLAAAVEKGKLVGFEADPLHEEVRWGAIYRAQVKGIDAALDAAFLDLDGTNTGILYNADVRIRQKSGTIISGGEKPIGKLLKSGDIVIVQAKTGYIPKAANAPDRHENKTAQMSMDITLSGRYLIFCAMMDESRISQRIRDKTLRSRIRRMLDSLTGTEGFIVRAAAASVQTEILMREGQILKDSWKEMQPHFLARTPGLVMAGPDSIQRTLSDQAGQRIETIDVVTMDHFDRVEKWCALFAPDLVTKITPVELKDAENDLALFHHRDIMDAVGELFHPYTLMTYGANLLVQETAALTAIDVNRGADKRATLAINLDAAHEVARQIRLRNFGGIILVDFLKCRDRHEQNKILKALEQASLDDPCTVQIHGFTKLGLAEITRKRRTPLLADRLDRALL